MAATTQYNAHLRSQDEVEGFLAAVSLTLSEVARSGYAEQGRGVVLIQKAMTAPPMTAESTSYELYYMAEEDIMTIPSPRVQKQLAYVLQSYDPDCAAVVVILHYNGRWSGTVCAVSTVQLAAERLQ